MLSSIAHLNPIRAKHRVLLLRSFSRASTQLANKPSHKAKHSHTSVNVAPVSNQPKPPRSGDMSSPWPLDPFIRDPFRTINRLDPFRTSSWVNQPLRSFDDYIRNRINEAISALSDANGSPTGVEQQADSTATQGTSQELATTRQERQLMMRPPRLDITENDQEYALHMDLPGMKKDQVKVTVDNGFLCIEGERNDEREDKTDTRHVVERSFGHFHRRLRLPPNAQGEQIKAGMENGVLQLTIPKKPEEATQGTEKRIEIH
ncbi:HSP20-like chaperone [Cladochytrium replicatum]|nr:HSP20-like chaperone [Cladochytrium replicatum]